MRLGIHTQSTIRIRSRAIGCTVRIRLLLLLVFGTAITVSACGLQSTVPQRSNLPAANPAVGSWLKGHSRPLYALLVAATLPQSHPGSSLSDLCLSVKSAASEIDPLPPIQFAEAQRQWESVLSNLSAAVHECTVPSSASQAHIDVDMQSAAHAFTVLTFGESVPPFTTSGHGETTVTSTFTN